MNRYKQLSLASVLLLMFMASCVKDLDTVPLNKRIATAASIYDDPNSYKEFLAKLYGSMTLTGQRGQYGMPEISASDEGTTSFLRMYWSAQEVTTDEAINAWGDPGLVEYHSMNWSSQNLYISLMYQRIFINIAYCNEYVREVSPRISGLSADMQADVKQYIAEARFLRAYFYWCALDLWGNVPFVTEADAPGAYLPKQISRADLFKYIESELNDIIPQLADAGKNEYARADKAAAWTLLARLYLNAQVYNQTDRNTDCITACNNIINSGAFSLNSNYADLFLADNDKLRNEIIFPIAEDGTNTQDYGGVTYIINAEVGANSNVYASSLFGIASGWAGNRFTNTFVNKFADTTGATDKRALFYTKQSSVIEHPTNFNEGYLSLKFRNITSTGVNGSNTTFVDTDFPIFRLAEVYLMYAEAVLRGGAGGDLATATSYVNKVITRAYNGDNSSNIQQADLTLQFLLDERGRELHWEAQRRTDLIRFNQFTGNTYLWDWKGNVQSGATIDAKYNLFALPSSDLAINTNLVQNPGY